jgi:hypothetical protein
MYTPSISKYLTSFNSFLYDKYLGMERVLKLHYVINYIIVKIHNNYKFCFELDEWSKLVKKLK